MKQPISIELLEKYVDGKCTPEEIALVKEWYFSFDNELDHVSDLTQFEQKELEDHIYSQILHTISVGEEEDVDFAEALPVRRTYTAWYAVAGIAATLLICLGLFFNNRPSTSASGQMASNVAQEIVLITNNTHQIYKKILPDNSIVWLSPGAKLKFPKIFDPRFRAVTMSGECFYEVTKNPNRPFIISSRSIVTKVWGTSFRVRDKVESNSADVSVITGKVSVSIKPKEVVDDVDYALHKNELILYPHQKAVYLADKNILRSELIVRDPNLQVWTRQNLTFDNKPLGEIIPVLNSKFHVHIKVVNERLNHYIMNADMAGFNLPDVLEAFKKSLNVSYEIKNDTIELQQ